jgi:predicted Na+-dependent transporter
MKWVSIFTGVIMLLGGFRLTTDWNNPKLEFALNVIVIICATMLIIVPIIVGNIKEAE